MKLFVTISELVMVLCAFLSCNNSSFNNSDNAGELVDLPFYNDPEFNAVWIDSDDPAYQQIHTIAPFELINQNGDTISDTDFDNKIFVANFFFTICPGVCPRMTGNLMSIQSEFKTDSTIRILSHTVMPWVDSVSVLKEYAEQRGIESKWDLVTGTKEQLYTLGRGSYFADEGFGKSVTLESDFLHTENIILVDDKKRIRGVYNGTLPLEMTRLIEDIYTLKKELKI